MEPASTRPRLHGYYERGVVNAVFESIAAHPDGLALLDSLLKRMVLWENRYNIKGFSLKARLVDCEIYIEPSLSDFGNPDVLLLTQFEGHGMNQRWSATFFIEAKMEPFLMSSPPTPDELAPGSSETDYLHLAAQLTGCNEIPHTKKYTVAQIWSRLLGKTLPKKSFYQQNASTILHELFLKYRFWETHLNSSTAVQGTRNQANGFKAYSGKSSRTKKADRARKVGSDPLVLRMVRRLREQGSSVHFVSLTTDPAPSQEHEAGGSWPLGMAVASRFLKIANWNKDGLEWKKDGLKWPPGDPKTSWYEMSHLLSWLDVWDWAEEVGLDRVRATLAANEEKFSFWPRCDDNGIEYLRKVIENRDQTSHWTVEKKKAHPWRASLKRNGTPCLSITPISGFTKSYRICVVKERKTALDTLKTKGLPNRFHLVQSADGKILDDADGCLACVLKTLQAQDAGHGKKP